MPDKRPFFFCHIPKTAGLTLQGLIARNFMPADVAEAFTWTTLLKLERALLASKKLVQGHFYGPLEAHAGITCFRFTLLRDPVERALSHYGHVLRDERHYLHRRAKELGTFEAYLDDPETRMTVVNFQARMLGLDCDIESVYQGLAPDERDNWTLERLIETTDLCTPTGDLLDRARQRLDGFDVVGLTERFDESLALLCYRRGWPFPEEIHSTNINADRPRRQALAPDTLARLIELNAIDSALYESARERFLRDFRAMLAGLVTNQARKSSMKALLGRLHG